MRRDGIQSADGHTYIHAYSHTDRQTDMVTYVHSYRHTYMQTACKAVEIAAKQTLCEDEASLAAGLEAMEIAIDPMESALG